MHGASEGAMQLPAAGSPGVRQVGVQLAIHSPSSSDASPSATVRLRALSRMREKERAALAAERADLEFLCEQDYLESLKKQQDKKKRRKIRERMM
eukprot:3801968-Pleurochrysis_carterae.AAC.1